jgi:hypothetical protein
MGEVALNSKQYNFERKEKTEIGADGSEVKQYKAHPLRTSEWR